MKMKPIMAAIGAAFLLAVSSTPAYAQGNGQPEETPVAESAIETEENATTPNGDESEVEPNPFTPGGTGTVVNNATDQDGKEFYSIMTADEQVFYLVIDKQRESDNVYFLNAVTEKDLLSLAEKSEDTAKNSTGAIPGATSPTTPTPEIDAGPEVEELEKPAEESGNGMSVALIAVIVLIAGGIGYYFKIYRPKRQTADSESEYEADYDTDHDDSDIYDDEADFDEDADALPWDEEEADKDGEV